MCPEEYRECLCNLSSGSPVCATFHYRDVGSMEELLNSLGKTSVAPRMWKNLQESIPILYKLLSSLQSIPDFFHPILEELIKKVKIPFEGSIANTGIPEGAASSLACYPSMKLLRNRGSYQVDKHRTKPVCSKQGTRHPTLMPGIFTSFCPHGVYIT